MCKKLLNGDKNLLIAVILISAIGAGILEYFWNKKEVNSIPAISPVVSVNPSNSPVPAITLPPEVWETYTNSQLGFSIKYPQMVYGVYRCEPYILFYVPLKVFEDNKNGIVYMTEEYYYDNWDVNAQANTGLCKKITHSIESLNKERETTVAINDKVSVTANPFLTKVFIIKNINNDIELNKFIKSNFGSGCFAEKKDPWLPQKGVYEITIKGEDWDKGADLGSTTCPFNYTYKILYAPQKNKLMSVNLGQECTFQVNTESQSYKCYDNEMIDSFKFE